MKLFISSSDYTYFEKPIELVSFEKIQVSKKWLLKIRLKDAVISDGHFSSLGNHHYDFYLQARYQKDDIKNLNKFPIAVYVLYQASDSNLDKDNFVNIAWANLYDNLDDAQNYTAPYSNSFLKKLLNFVFK